MNNYLLLWSGDVRGMKKQRIPTALCKGFLHHVDENGNHVVPDRNAIRAALPKRLRPAFDRSVASQFDRIGKPDAPLHYGLYDRRGKWITTIYLQPVTD